MRELTNILLGRIKGYFLTFGMNFKLSIPQIIKKGETFSQASHYPYYANLLFYPKTPHGSTPIHIRLELSSLPDTDAKAQQQDEHNTSAKEGDLIFL